MGQLKKLDFDNDDDESMFALTKRKTLRKTQRSEVEIFPRKCSSIIKDGKLSRSES